MKYSILVLLICFSCSNENLSPTDLFKQLDLNANFHQSNQLLKKSIKTILWDMQKITAERPGYQPLVDEAKVTIEAFRQHYAYIDSLKQILEEEAHFQANFRALSNETVQVFNDTKLVTQLFFSGNSTEKKTVSILEKKLLNLKNASINKIANLWENSRMKGTIFMDPSKKEPTLNKLEKAIPLTSPERFRLLEQSKTTSWSTCNFKNSSLIEAITLLTKFQNDVLSIEYVIVDFLNSQIGRLCDFGSTLDRPLLLLQTDAYKIRLGDFFEGKLVLFFNETPLNFRASVNGSELEIRDNRAIYKVKPTSTGIQTFTVNYSVVNSNQYIEHYSKTFSFTVEG